MSTGLPVRCTGITARVRGVIASARRAGSIRYSALTSTKTGVAPVITMAPAVATKLLGAVITSSPGPDPEGPQGEEERVGARVEAERVGRAAHPGEAPLELGHLGPEDELAALELVHHPRDDRPVLELAGQIHVLDVHGGFI